MIRLMVSMAGLLLSACASYPLPDEAQGRESFLPSAKLDLNLCNTKVSNPPNSIAGRVLRESSYSCVNRRSLLLAPAPGACVSSGYGRRSGKLHHGLDYQSLPAGPVIAAAAGTIVRKRLQGQGFWELDRDRSRCGCLYRLRTFIPHSAWNIGWGKSSPSSAARRDGR